MKRFSFFFLILVAISSCIKPPNYPIEPHIEFVSISDTMISMFDSVDWQISFTDGDGDIGWQVQDLASCNFCDSSCYEHPTIDLFIKRSNSLCIIPSHLPYITPKGKIDDISGKIFVNSGNIFAFPGETVIYTIQIKDRAGHFSNVVETPPIIIQ